jgi:hypothetical protein
MTSWNRNISKIKRKIINTDSILSEKIFISNTQNIINNNQNDINFIDNIDAILYINLEHRPDRNEHCIQEIKKIDSTLHKTHRIDAIYNKDNGAMGCSLSHIKAVEYFLENTNWNTCIILEDDFSFYSDDTSYINNILNNTLINIPDYDIILLGTGIHDFNYTDTQISFIKKVQSSQTCSGYIIKRNYANILLNNFIDGVNDMKTNGRLHENHIDQYWKQLMPLGNWYTILPRISYQYVNYSDIEKKTVDYGC